MERNNEIIKLEQQHARISAIVKQMDIDKLELTRQMHDADQELPRLKMELDTARCEAESKRQALEQSTHSSLHSEVVKKIDFVHESSIAKDNFYMMAKKSEIERELNSKIQDNERKTIEFKQKQTILKKSMYDIDRQSAEHQAEKRDIERQIEAIKQKIELARRSSAGKPKIEKKEIIIED